MQDDLDAAERQPNDLQGHKDIDTVPSAARKEPTYKADRPLLGLASYALSSVFLASMLTFAKILGKKHLPVFEILLTRSMSILVISLLICAKDRVNPFGNRYHSFTRAALRPAGLALF